MTTPTPVRCHGHALPGGHVHACTALCSHGSVCCPGPVAEDRARQDAALTRWAETVATRPAVGTRVTASQPGGPTLTGTYVGTDDDDWAMIQHITGTGRLVVGRFHHARTAPVSA